MGVLLDKNSTGKVEIRKGLLDVQGIEDILDTKGRNIPLQTVRLPSMVLL